MYKRPSNVNPWDELDKWVNLPPQDEPRGEPGTNGGDSGSIDQPRDVRKVIPEFESKCTAINIAGEILAARRYTVT